jgi:uncharacterized protein involved in exopolysaccharide biosynthesis
LIDLIEFGRYYQRQWKLVVAIFCFSAAIGVLYFVIATPLFRAQVILQFQPASQADGLSSTLGIGLALTGLQGDRSLPERAKGFGILKSRAFLLPFIQRMNLYSAMFPSRFDESTNTWKRGMSIPTQDDLHKAFVDRVMTVDDSASTGLITVSVLLPNAQQAASVANTLISDLNERLRRDAILQANENLDYLNKQLALSQIAEIRQVIAQLVQAEMKRLLLASGQTTHAFRVVDPATVPDKLYAPRALLVIALAFLSAFMLSLFVVVIRFLVSTAAR